MRALEKNKTWEIEDSPREKKKIVGCKWVFTTKYKPDGTLERYKVRLVAKGFTQTYGIGYLETFALVAKLNTVRILLSLATTLDWPLQQLDIKNAFLNGDLKKKSICILRRVLNKGLDQRQGYSQAQTDHTMFIKLLGDGKITILIMDNEMNRLKTCLTVEFEIKDLGSLRYFLGIEVARSKKGIVVSQ
ncbi:hypothetical protein AAG906_003424 [Vitis piasezkii]